MQGVRTVIGLLAFSPSRRRPGCVLLQACLGGSSALAQRFPTETWLLAPTDDMRVYPVADEAQLGQLGQLVEIAKEACK